MSSPLRLPAPITPTRIRSLAPFARFGSRYGIAVLARPALVNVRRDMFSLTGSSLCVLWSGSQKEIGPLRSVVDENLEHLRRNPPILHNHEVVGCTHGIGIADDVQVEGAGVLRPAVCPEELCAFPGLRDVTRLH